MVQHQESSGLHQKAVGPVIVALIIGFFIGYGYRGYALRRDMMKPLEPDGSFIRIDDD
jgi:hypothetical protein